MLANGQAEDVVRRLECKAVAARVVADALLPHELEWDLHLWVEGNWCRRGAAEKVHGAQAHHQRAGTGRGTGKEHGAGRCCHRQHPDNAEGRAEGKREDRECASVVSVSRVASTVSAVNVASEFDA